MYLWMIAYLTTTFMMLDLGPKSKMDLVFSFL